MTRRWIVFIAGCVGLIVCIGIYRNAEQEQAVYTRGWELPTRQKENMPLRTGSIAGINVDLTQYEGDTLATQLDSIAELGFVWVRQPIYWEQVEATPDTFDWSLYDPLMEALSVYPQLKLVAVLDGTPRWARHRLAPDHPFAPPASPAEFGDFVRAFAARYGAQVDFYQIWDEPNIREHWGNLDPQPALYVAMLNSAYEAIHDTDAEAIVITAALAPTTEDGPENLSDILYLKAIYDLGGRDYFDAAAGKPYGFDRAPDDRTVEWGVLNFSRLILLREEMVARGDGDKPLWGSNFGWNHLPDDWQGPPSIWGQVDATTQIRYTQQAFARATTEWAWLGGLILQHWQPNAPSDDPIQGFAVAPALARWKDSTPFTDDETLSTGRYPVTQPQINYEGNWQFGDLGADAVFTGDDLAQNTITIPFYGTEFAMLVRRDNYTAYLLVTIDGENANALPTNQQGKAFIILTSASRQPSLDLITVAKDLPEGNHSAKVVHFHRMGEDHWPIAGFAVATPPDVASYEQHRLFATLGGMVAVVLGAIAAYRLPFQKVKLPSQQALRDTGDTITTLVVTAIFMVGAALSWEQMFVNFFRRDPPALLMTVASVGLAVYVPLAWFSLVALLVFGVIVFNRPLMGLLAVIFWSMFFTTTIDTYFRLFHAVEILLLISAAAVAGRVLYNIAQNIRSAPPENPKKNWIQRWDSLQGYFFTHTRLSDVLMIAFCGLAVLSISWADLRPEALRELRAMILGPALLYFLVRLLALQREELALIGDTILIGGAAVALMGLYNYATGKVVEAEGLNRLISTYGSPNSAALQLGRCLPFALAYIVLPLGEWRRIVGGICGFMMLVAALLTQSIAALVLGLPVAFAVVILGWQRRRAILPLLGAAAAGLVALVPLSQFIPRLKNLTDFESSTALFRLNVWRSTLQLIQDYPLTGVGLDQFLYAYRSRYILPEAWEDPDLSHPHNIVLDYWVRLGLLGVLLGIALQVAFWRTVWRAYQHTRGGDVLLFALVLGAMGSMTNFLFHGLVDSAHFAINLSYFFALTLALVQRIADLPFPRERKNND